MKIFLKTGVYVIKVYICMFYQGDATAALYITDVPIKRCKKLLSPQQVSSFPYLLRLSITFKNIKLMV